MLIEIYTGGLPRVFPLTGRSHSVRLQDSPNSYLLQGTDGSVPSVLKVEFRVVGVVYHAVFFDNRAPGHSVQIHH